jgi:hypothetical protein
LAWRLIACLPSRRGEKEEYFLFADPCEVFDFCTTLTKVLLFRHDYLPQDFTVFLYKD